MTLSKFNNTLAARDALINFQNKHKDTLKPYEMTKIDIKIMQLTNKTQIDMFMATKDTVILAGDILLDTTTGKITSLAPKKVQQLNSIMELGGQIDELDGIIEEILCD